MKIIETGMQNLLPVSNITTKYTLILSSERDTSLPVCCYGAGAQSANIKLALKNIGIDCTLFCDKIIKSDTIITGIKFIPVKSAIEMAKDKKIFIIISVTTPQKTAIIKQLCIRGISNFGIVCLERSYDPVDNEYEKTFMSNFLDMMNYIYEDVPLTPKSFQALSFWYFVSPCWFIHYEDIFRKYISTYSHPRICDIGPGFGEVTLTLRRLYDFDLTYFVLPNFPEEYFPFDSKNYVNSLKDITIKKGYFELDDVEKGEYDIIFFLDVLEHLICHPINSLKKIKRMLHNDGVVILSTPNADQSTNLSYYSDWKEYRSNDIDVNEYNRLGELNNWHHVYEYRKEELLELIQTAGFECIDYKLGKDCSQLMVLKKK